MDPGKAPINDRKGPEKIAPLPFRSPAGRRPRPAWRVAKGLAAGTLALVLAGLLAGIWFVFTARQVTLKISPLPEQVVVKGTLPAPRWGAHYLLRPGTYTIHAQKECYAPLAASITVGAAQSQNFSFNLDRQPGKLSVAVHPRDDPARPLAGVQVWVDGQPVGHPPMEDLPVAAGSRILAVQAARYQSHQQEIEIEGCGRRQKVQVALNPDWAAVSLDSNPTEVPVRVDGRAAGQTPLVLELMSGPHEIELLQPGYQPWQTRITVKAGEPVDLATIGLKPADGRLRLTSKPSGANVLIAGRYAGQTPLAMNLAANEEHTLHLTKAGFERARHTISLAAGAEKTLQVDLVPATGEVIFRVAPADAELVIDGKSRGPVPPRLELVAAARKIEIRKAGYHSHRITLTPRPGLVQEVAVALKPLAAPPSSTASASPPGKAAQVTAANGYRLVLIHPEKFVMGSSRREQGRRSNESRHTVNLTRPFYMGLTEVTNREFRAFRSGHSSGMFKTHSLNGDQQPVARVTWEAAARFCNWLSKQDNLPPVYLEAAGRVVAKSPLTIGYRLPTEAEWEFCARSGGGPHPGKYPWPGRYPPPRNAGNFADESARGLLGVIVRDYTDGFPASAPPAKFKPNSLGIFDLAGNAGEWCHDFYAIQVDDGSRVATDPAGPDEGHGLRVVRGSTWKDASISALRSAYRDYGNEEREDLGFRICRYAGP